MAGRLLVDLVIDRIKSAGVPEARGARLERYDASGDVAALDQLIGRHSEAWDAFAYNSRESRAELARIIATGAATDLDHSPENPLIDIAGDAVLALIESEPGFLKPNIHDLTMLSPLERSNLAQDLTHRIALLTDETPLKAAVDTLYGLVTGLFDALPASVLSHSTQGDPALTTELVALVEAPHDFMTKLLAHFISSETVQQNGLFSPVYRQLYRNVLEASGVLVDPDESLADHDTDKPTLPGHCMKDPASEVAARYFSGTPLLELMQAPVPFALSVSARFEHCHVLGGTGHGKTQCLQYLINQDLVRAANDETLSLVVIDSQGSLIRNLASSVLFDPDNEDSLADRFLLIDPADVTSPPALNLFDPGVERLDGYGPRERELAFNALVDIYGRFFGTLLGAELTARQGAVFRYLARLMLTIPSATIHTLIELMDDVRPFAHHIEKLDPTARRFFEKEFARKGFNATRRQIKDRLYAVLSIPTFDRLFSAPKSKVSFFDALNSGKIVLINTARDLLKEDGTAIFGRFMLALIEHAVAERATMAEDARTPAFLYMDEAHEYFDGTVENLLVEARKFKCGLTLAHQNLAQLTPRLRAIFMGNTTIKLAGGVSDADARALAPDMRTTPDFLLSMRKRERASETEFALSVRNQTPQALKVRIPLGHLEAQSGLAPHQMDALLATNRDRIGYVPQVDDQTESTKEAASDTGEESARQVERPLPETPPQEEPESVATPPVKPKLPVARAPSNSEPVTAHRALQERIRRIAQERGFAATIEQPVAEGRGSVDLSLERGDMRIAVEVSATTRPAQEWGNIEKCLTAEYGEVWATSPDAAHLDVLRAELAPDVSPADQNRVRFLTPEEIVSELDRLAAHAPASRSTVLGYEVLVSHESTTPAETAERRDRLRAALISAWKVSGAKHGGEHT